MIRALTKRGGQWRYALVPAPFGASRVLNTPALLRYSPMPYNRAVVERGVAADRVGTWMTSGAKAVEQRNSTHCPHDHHHPDLSPLALWHLAAQWAHGQLLPQWAAGQIDDYPGRWPLGHAGIRAGWCTKGAMSLA